MQPIQGPSGEVRPSADGWGVGLYSADDRYRYWFLTEVDPERRPGSTETSHSSGLPVVQAQTLVWVGLNPSHSDDTGKTRSTLRMVLHWAQRAGLTRVLGVNLYAYRDTKPAVIRERLRTDSLDGVIGVGNDTLLSHVADDAEHVLLGWGSDGRLGGRGAQVASLFPTGQCVGVCNNGEPYRPGRKAKSLEFTPYVRR